MGLSSLGCRRSQFATSAATSTTVRNPAYWMTPVASATKSPPTIQSAGPLITYNTSFRSKPVVSIRRLAPAIPRPTTMSANNCHSMNGLAHHRNHFQADERLSPSCREYSCSGSLAVVPSDRIAGNNSHAAVSNIKTSAPSTTNMGSADWRSKKKGTRSARMENASVHFATGGTFSAG